MKNENQSRGNRALRLIFEGLPSKSAVESALADADSNYVRRRADDELSVGHFYRHLEALAINSAIDSFEHSDVQAHQWEDAQLLSAYFHYAKSNGLTTTADGESVDALMIRFAAIIFKRLCGFERDDRSSHAIPRWATPDVAFGRKPPNVRLRDGNLIFRSIAIVAFLEKLKLQGTSRPQARKRAMANFDVKASAITAAQSDVPAWLMFHADPKELDVHIKKWFDSQERNSKY